MSAKPKVHSLYPAADPAAVAAAQWRTTDIANAETFIDEHGARLRCLHPGAIYHEWDGGRWLQDKSQRTWALAQDTIKGWWVEVGCAGSPEERTILAKHFLSTGRDARVKAMLALAASNRRIAVTVDDLDQHPDLLTVGNGTVDLYTGTLRASRPEDLITRRTPIPYDPKATCPRFLAFLDLIFSGDQALVDFIQRAVGYTLTGSIGAQCFFFCWGTGGNGKTQLIETIRAIAGEHARAVMPTMLMAKAHEEHATEFADLRGARFVTSIETERDRRLAEVKIKWMTDGGKMKGRFMKKDSFEFMPTHKIWMLGNYKPVITGTDLGMWRRVMLIPFTVEVKAVLPADAVVDDFHLTLVDEYPGILKWAVDGAMIWHTEGLRPPAAVLDATTRYRQEMDVVGTWLEEACDRDPRARTPFKVLYDAYQEETRRDAMSKREFAQELTRLGIDLVDVGGVKFRKGVRLREASDAQ